MLFLVVVAALVVGGYLYLRLDDEIRRHVEARLAGHYSELRVHVGRARFEQDYGITVYNVSILEAGQDGTARPLVSVDEVLLACNSRVEELVAGKLCVDRIVLRRPQLRAVRRADGTWSLRALLPLPRFSDQPPLVHVENATLYLEDEARGESAPMVVRGVDLKLTPEPTAGHFRVEGSASGSPARSLSFSGTVAPDDGAMDLTIQAVAVEVTPQLLPTLPVVPITDVQQAQLTGQADVTLRLVRPAGADGPVEWSAHATLDRGRLEHAALVQPLTELSLELVADGQRLSIERLTAKCGPADVALACQRHGWSDEAPLGLALRVVGLPVDERLQAALPDCWERLWRRFQPVGIVDGVLRLQFDGRQWRPHLTAECRNLSLTDAEKFPYRLEGASGTIEYAPAAAGDGSSDTLQINLTAQAAGRPIRLDSQFSQLAACMPDGDRQAGRPIGWVEITGRDVPIHEQLIAALSDAPERLVRSLQPQGTFDVRWRAEWARPDQLKAEITNELRLNNCTLKYERFPYPLRQVNGRLTERNRHWTLHGVEGRGANEAAVVECHGEAQLTEAGCRVDLLMQAANVPLDEALKRATSPTVQAVWSELRPQGRVGATAHVVHSPEQPAPSVSLVLTPHERTVSIEPRSFPYRLDQIEGRALVENGAVQLENVVARHGRVALAVARGTCQATPQGGWQVGLSGVNVDGLTAHRDLVLAMPPRLQRLVERLQPRGTFNVYNSTLAFAKNPDVARVVAEWDMQIDCHQATIHAGLPLENVSGALRLVGRDDGTNCYSAGELAIDSLFWKDMQLTAIRGPLWVDRSVLLLGRSATAKQAQPPRPIAANAYGGNVVVDVQMQHDGHPRYQMELALDGADLARFANERTSGPRSMSGTVAGRLSLAGTGRSTHALQGQGELHVVDANIYELPVLVALLKVLRNRTPNTTAFNQCHMQFTVQGEHVHFQRLDLLGDAVSLYGRGESDFARNVSLVFYSLMGPADLPIPGWKSVAGRFSEQLLRLKVDGNMDSPDIQRQMLPAMDDAFQQIQSELQAGAGRVVPPAASRNNTTLPRR